MKHADQNSAYGTGVASFYPTRKRARCVGGFTRLVILVGLACACLRLVPAQSAATTSTAPKLSPEQLARNANQEAALVALKSGDVATALAKLDANIRRDPGAPHEDLQLGAEFADVACRLKEQRNPSATQLAVVTAVSILSRSRAVMPAKDANASRLLEAQLYDHVLVDRSRAIAAYEAALIADPKARSASERLLHLKAIDELARRKTAANDLLRARISQPGR